MLIEESFKRLFPHKEFRYNVEEKYALQLSDFNANIRLNKNKILVKYNLQWKNIDDEIKIGLIQALLLKLFKVKDKKSISYVNINLYNDFLKQIPNLIEKTKCDPLLKNSFNRVNDQFFDNLLEKPNLVWGTYSVRKLACYNFHNDTVSVSKIFQNSKEKILDLLMYHELLHKKFQFKHNKGRSSYHCRDFKAAENLYPSKDLVEKEIEKEIRYFKKTQRQSSGRDNSKKKFDLLRFFK